MSVQAPVRSNLFVGSPIERREDLRFLTGRGQYVDDLIAEGMLYAVILRSAVAHGRIRAVDGRAALARPGVHAVITAAEIGKVPTIPLRHDPTPAIRRFEQPVIANGKVRYVGEPIAVVIADSPALAEDALELVEVDIEPLAAVADRVSAGRDEVVLFETNGSNLPDLIAAARGDADAAFATAPYRRREHFRVQRHAAVPMEPRGLLAEWDEAAGCITVRGVCKVPFTNRAALSQMMGLPEEQVRMLEYDVGGGFGARGEFYPEDFLIPFAARHLRRPIKWTEDRRENLAALNHAREMDCELEIACERDGTVVALRAKAFTDLGAYMRTNGATAARNISQVMCGPYRIPHVRVDVQLVVTNKTPVGTYRGPGRFESDFCRERLFDMAAADLGIDRVAFRRRNLIAETEMPYPLPTVQQLDIAGECDSGDYRQTLARCLDEFKWEERLARNGKLIEGRYHGIAVGCYLEGGGTGPRENVRLVLEGDGTVTLYTGSSSVGQGVETVLAQIAADALQMPMERINQVLHGSTDYLAKGYGSFSSRTIVMAGNAIADAAGKLRELIRQAAAQRLGCTVAEIALEGGKAVASAGAIDLGTFAGLAADGTFASNKRTYSYGSHAAYVAVDARTGHVALLDYVAVEDVGRIVNPLTLHGQCIGAVVQGLGGAFLEQFCYDENGQLLTGSFADYLLPSASDFPVIRAFTLEEKPSPLNPLGFKGAGEGGIIPVGGVVANAVAAALADFAVQPRELPLSPPRLWELIRQGGSAAAPPAQRPNSPAA